MANIKLMRQVMADIEDNPGDFNQRSWKRCFAGRTVRLAGDEVMHFTDYATYEIPGAGSYAKPIKDRAQELLGVNALQASALFQGGATTEQLRRRVNRYTRTELLKRPWKMLRR